MLFKDEVKVIASAGTDQPNSGTKVVKANPVPALVTTDNKQKQNIEVFQKKQQISVAEIK